MSRQLRLVALCFCSFLLIPLAVAEESPSRDSDRPAEEAGFLRLRRSEDNQPLALDTAIVSFEGAHGGQAVTVDLIGAVHVADRRYYEQLNEEFKQYDVVLYELVAPRDVAPQPGQRSPHPVSLLQVTMKSLLGLEFQLDRVDYRPDNFVHADLTPEEFADSMNQRGESFLQMFSKMLGQSVAMQSKDPTRSSDAQLFGALFAKADERSLRLKRFMADQFEEMETAAAVLEGPDGSTILTERNKAAFKVLSAELGKGRTRLAIFYGAAHLPDMQKRLLAEFQLQRKETRWLTAWDMSGDIGANR